MASEDSPHPINESPRHPRRFSLVHQASCETQRYAGLKRHNTIKHRQQLEGDLVRGRQILQQLNDEGVELIWAANQGRIAFSMVLSSFGGIVKNLQSKFTTLFSIEFCKQRLHTLKKISRILHLNIFFTAPLPLFISAAMTSFQVSSIKIDHLETRKSIHGKGTENVESWDILVDCDGSKDDLVTAAAALIQNHTELKSLALYKKNQTDDVPWFPRHVSDLDKCSNCTTKYEPTTDPRHPGHADDAYIARRKFLNDQALEYKYGDPIPIVEYLEEEHATWQAVYEKLRGLHESHTCETYRKNLKILEEECVLNPVRIPQIKDVNDYLRKRTGFMLRPCSGLLSARDFLASLAFRVFQTTTYLRHSGSPHHSPEPDLIHELLGHVPMFADPFLAQLSQDIGLMSLGATDEQIEKLATVYWFIVEFGLCREKGSLKAIGAGLLSAYGELMHACSDLPEHRDFDPATTAVQKYEDDDYQPLYFVADSIQDAMVKLRLYAVSMERPFSVIYNPYTQTVEVVSNTFELRSTFERFQIEFSAITNAVDRINKHQGST